MNKPGFKKGDKNINRRGRPLKATNRISRPLKLSIAEFLEQRFSEMAGIWDELKAKERAQLFIDLLPFVIPKQSTADVKMNLSQLSDDDIDIIINKLFENEQNGQN